MAQEHYNQGIAKAAAGDYLGAVHAFSRALQANPEWVEAYYRRGLALFDLGDRQGAIADYNQALTLQPKFLDAYLGRSMARLAIQDLEGAIADVNQIIQLTGAENPKAAIAYQTLGLIHKKSGKPIEAIAAYKQAANLYLTQKDEVSCRRCIESYQQLQATQPPSPEDFFQQAANKVKAKDYLGALLDLNWMIQLDSQNIKAICMRSVVQSKLGEYKQALQDVNQALFLNPQDLGAKIARGIIRTEMGDAQGAIADFDRLLQEHPRSMEVYVARAEAKCKLRDYRQGIEDFSRAISLQPDNPELYCDRAEARNQFGDLQGAIDDYQQAANQWFHQGDMKHYRQAIDQIKSLQQAIAVKESDLKKRTSDIIENLLSDRRNYAVNYPTANPNVSLPSLPSPEIQQKLLGLVGGNMAMAQRLIEIAKQNYPNMPEEWYWKKVIFDIESDSERDRP
ncbi:tetratricopeptide repeat protein [Tumidithrix elongata RA019]|uniref:Tetratricopeptide repeat protein n=1 Tax=Tumidithrix elongata BACA0141 TaxID=2716417 RepID=A0AAW9Q2E0_9CYAN|nr:tetratricopeptide repeat protein [Tumidithrix elongata RA019]